MVLQRRIACDLQASNSAPMERDTKHSARASRALSTSSSESSFEFVLQDPSPTPLLTLSDANPTPGSDIPTTKSPPNPNLLTLPAELLPHLAAHLSYPDILALRHTHPRFYHSSLIATSRNKYLKVAWLIARAYAGLPIPKHSKLRLENDEAFCGNREVREILRRRLRHGECGSGEAGCRVLVGGTCGGSRPWRKGGRSWRLSGGRGWSRRWKAWTVLTVVSGLATILISLWLV